ncbi:PQQ-dependent sugar dehydrogenase [Chitinophagaceae bacterium LB-8]|uniref:PQQ-dependent sugar dehydrogenase n=1 Tax=Paraflavisolibacter caeni TaxID=2982496 RepID=A0A9X3B795_9BACT|nr:Ig-like domain-containing protein [Paraflavisolibacter caeni]MCU7548256.1 PQQ-dependent sugar dehydrogenase [Paraflavisolibacter caeni]
MRTSFLNLSTAIAAMFFLLSFPFLQTLDISSFLTNTVEFGATNRLSVTEHRSINLAKVSSISNVFHATNFSAGPYSATGNKGAYALTNLMINFQDVSTVPPGGWLVDFGQPYGARTSANQGTGNTYGWVKRVDNTLLDMTAYGRKRSSPSDVLLATLMHMQPSGATEGKWEALVVNGTYNVTVSVGDGSYVDSKHYINIEGTAAIVNFIPTTSNRFKSSSVTVTVSDGKLTVDAIGGTNTKINYIIIQPSISGLNVNFQDSATVPPAGWLKDFGQPFGVRTSAFQGSGNTYGWIHKEDNTPLDLTLNGRRRSKPSNNLLQATLMHMQADDVVNFAGTPIEGRWEAQIPNGLYDVTVSIGDAVYFGPNKQSINIEGVLAIIDYISTATAPFKTATVTVEVRDGRLTVDAFGGNNTKINYISIVPSTSSNLPFVETVNPPNRSGNVGEYSSLSTDVLNLPNGGINNATITPATVFLTEGPGGPVVPANVNGTGGGDAITLVPSAPLKLSTTYVFNVTNGVKDLSGAGFIPFSSAFTTTSVPTPPLPNVTFTKVQLTNTTGKHSSLTIGPDGKLYALTIDGIIKRFTINANGTLGTPQLIYSLQDAYGTRKQRLAVGFAFDPSSTATNLIAYVTHCTYVFQNAPDWDGKLTKLSGSNLQTVQDLLINLPRSSKDHVTNSITFGPDGALYFTQGSLSGMGAADMTWNMRDEHLLSAALLRLDLTKLSTLPLNVKTTDGGGTYNPYATNAPLTIYASGIRNAYDMVWHSNGELYLPTNGSAAGGNTPASVNGTLRPDGTTYNGPNVPALTDVPQTQKDYLFRVKKGGYYGHPNPSRGEYAMNGANPTAGTDPAQVDAYVIGTRPDVNWRGFAFDFQNNKSPNGAIEYKSNTFNGALQGKLLVVRYSQNDDIIALTPGGTNKDIVSFNEGGSIQGFTGFVDPLDLIEDVRNGNIYVSEYGGNGKITLLKPNTSSSSSLVSGNNVGIEQSVSSAYLEQNAPNPFSDNTVIGYGVPQDARSMKLVITDMRGTVVKKVSLTKGKGQITIAWEELPAGTYVYSLWIDDKQIDSKKMILHR